MRRTFKASLLVAAALTLFSIQAPDRAFAGGPETMPAPAGSYKLDKSHASLIFRVNHLGFSNYTARFRDFDAELKFDPANPAAMSVNATIDPASIETDYPDPKAHDFNAQLRSDTWLNTAKFPKITFRSTKVALTGKNTANVTGDLALHGVSVPVTLAVTFNGGYSGHPMDPAARIGFSARGSLMRSAFGISAGIPAAGSQMGVSDAVQVEIEAEFNGPPLPGAKPAQ